MPDFVQKIEKWVREFSRIYKTETEALPGAKIDLCLFIKSERWKLLVRRTHSLLDARVPPVCVAGLFLGG